MSLSLESLQLVFNYLDPITHQPPKPDLYRCIQVCKAWYKAGLPLLYHSFHIRIICPSAPDDAFQQQLASPHLPAIRSISIVIALESRYTLQQQCSETIRYLTQLQFLIPRIRNLERAQLDLFPFSPEDCLPSLWPRLEPANNHLLELVNAIVIRRPELHLRLGRPELMAEVHTELSVRPTLDDILYRTRGNIHSLFMSCQLCWLLPRLQQNPQIRELYFTDLSRGERSQNEAELLDIITHLPLDRLMLDGPGYVPVRILPLNLVELVLTHLKDTVKSTNEILTHLQNLRLLSLRLQTNPSESYVSSAIAEDQIVCSKLRKIWWTNSMAPSSIVATASRCFRMLESISPPQNVTDNDLEVLASSAERLKEIWLMDCPKVTISGIGGLKDLRNLKYLQLEAGLVVFLSEHVLTDFILRCATLREIRIIYENSEEETLRRAKLLADIQGGNGFKSVLGEAITFQSSNLGDKVIVDVRQIRSHLSK